MLNIVYEPLKMIIIGSVILVLIVLLCPTKAIINQNPLVETCSATTTAQEVFSLLLYRYLTSAHESEIIFGSSLPSKDAAASLYELNLRLLQEYGLQNAEDIASTVSNAISLVPEFSLDVCCLNTANALGEYLVVKGLMNCDNAIYFATEYFMYEEREFHSIVPPKMESNIEAIIRSLWDLFNALGFSLEEIGQNWKILIDLFYKDYSQYALLT